MINSAISTIQTGLAAGKRILELLEVDNSIKEVSYPKSITTFQQDIVFQNVCFRYEDSSVLKKYYLTC